MNEISKILEPKEKIIWGGKPQFIAYLCGYIILGGLIGGAVVGVFLGAILKSISIGIITGILVLIFGLITGLLVYRVTHYAITNKRVVFQKGIIGRDFRSIDYDKIQNASVNVGLIGVIFHVGTIKMFTGEIESTGGEHPTIHPKYDSFHYIENPYDILKILQKHLSHRKEKLYGGK